MNSANKPPFVRFIARVFTQAILPPWLVTAGFALFSAAYLFLILEFDKSLYLLQFLLPVLLWAAFLYPRWVTYSMLGVLVVVNLPGVDLRGENFLPQIIINSIRLLTTVALLELIYAMSSRRLKMAADLEETLAHLELIYDNVSDAILMESLQGEILDANQRACELYGYSKAELLRKNVRDLVPEDYHQHILIDDTPDVPVEILNLRANGERFPVEVSARRYRQGGQEGLLVVVRDISRRYHAEALLQQQTRLVLETSASATIQSASIRLLSGARSLPDIDLAALYLINTTDSAYELQNIQGAVEGHPFPATLALDTPLVASIRYGLPVFYGLDDVLPEPVAGIRQELGLQAVGIIPIFFQTSIVAAFIVASRSVPELPEETTSALETITFVAGNVLARLNAESHLRTSEARFRSIFENATIGLYQTSPAGQLLSANQALASLFGYNTPAEMIAEVGKDVTQLYVFPETRKNILADLNNNAPRLRTEVQFHHRSGRVIDAVLGTWVISDANGEMMYLEGYIQDITERRNLMTRLEVLHNIDKILLTSEDVENSLEPVLTEIRRLIPFEHAEVWTGDPAPSGSGSRYYRSVFHLLDGRLRQASRVLPTMRSLPLVSPASLQIVDDLQQAAGQLEESYNSLALKNWAADGWRACLAAHLVVQGKRYGEVVLLSKQPGIFTERESDLLGQAASLISISLQDLSLRRAEQTSRLQAEERAQRIDQLRRSAENLNETFNQQDVLETGLSILMEITGTDKGWVTIKDESSGEYLSTLQIGLALTPEELQAQCKANQPECSGYQLLAGSLNLAPRWLDCPLLASVNGQEPESSAILAVPLHSGRRLLGETHLVVPHNFALTQDLRQVLAAVGAQLGAALERADLFEQIHKLAIVDPLTGLYNRRYFFERADYEFRRSRRYGNSMALLMLDMDFFKRVNDRFGHPAGDQTLAALAQHLQNSMRNTDLLARYGGEEFVILLPETNQENALQTAHRLHALVRETPFRLEKGVAALTVSIGVAALDESCLDIYTLLDRADEALYVAKNNGRDQVCVWKNAG
jgi:diguanylate cyclase (GGDEF)-like protein/PAS domain S-box-containing protein